jgi:hypothetical protein
MKSVGKPDAGKPHVRFDERGRETGHRYRARPRLYPDQVHRGSESAKVLLLSKNFRGTEELPDANRV